MLKKQIIILLFFSIYFREFVIGCLKKVLGPTSRTYYYYLPSILIYVVFFILIIKSWDF
jgi:hypothetical protein